MCVRYHSSLLMHECLREHLCEIVPLHPCNCLSVAVRCVLLLRAFFHPLETQCDTAPARTGSLATIRAGQPSAVSSTVTFLPFLLFELSADVFTLGHCGSSLRSHYGWSHSSIWPPDSHLCIIPTLITSARFIHRRILGWPAGFLFLSWDSNSELN